MSDGAITGRLDRARALFERCQDSYCAALEQLDGHGRFREDRWQRDGGGGGRSRALAEGRVFAKAGVNVSDVHGELSPEFAATLPGEGTEFRATGVSLVVHPVSPWAPTVHMNLRCIAHGDDLWYGGGLDLTPAYVLPEDARHFHRVLSDACARHPVADHARFKSWCDEYFQIVHRGEARGVGGIFFDYLRDELDAVETFVADLGEQFLPAYLPIVERRRGIAYGQREKSWQEHRRGRYVEFNLVYDRGTLFGLKTGGRIESILMSLPPHARWTYDHVPEEGSLEARTQELLAARDWLR